MGSNFSLPTFLPPVSILLSRLNKRYQNNTYVEQVSSLGQDSATISFGFDKLPDTIILEIVSYLDSQDCIKASLLCRKWYYICHDHSLWTKLDFSSTSRSTKAKLRDKDIIRLIVRFPNALVRDIDLSGHCCRLVRNSTLFHVARRCHLLQTLNISNCKLLTDTGFEIVVKNCPYIEALYISNCSAITDIGVILAVRKLRSLKRLNMSGNSWITNLVLFHVARYARCLVYLSIEGCKKITDVGLHVLAGSKHLSLKHINLRKTIRITNGGLESFLGKVPTLEALELGFVKKSIASIAILEAVSRYCNNLVMLDFQNYKYVNIDDIICEVANKNPRLQYVAVREQLPKLSTETILTLRNLCPGLSKIESDTRVYL